MKERRFAGCEIRASQGDEGAMVVTGRAISYDVISHDLGGFKERLKKGCLTRSLRSDADSLYMNREHDNSALLGRVRAGTLEVHDKDDGLHFRCILPNNSIGRDTYESIRRGDLADCSFEFNPDEDGEDWDTDEDGFPLRTLRSIKLHALSIVASPAYACTSATVPINNNPSLGPLGRSMTDLFPEGVPAEVRAHTHSGATLTLNSEEELERIKIEIDSLLGGEMTRKDQKRLDAALAKMKLLRSSMTPLENRHFDLAQLLKEAGASIPKMSDKESRAWSRFARTGDAGSFKMSESLVRREQRANTEGAISFTAPQGAEGGFFVAPQMLDRLIFTAKQYDEIMNPEYSNQIYTAKGGVIPAPVFDDGNSASTLVGETLAGTEVDIANFGAVQLNGYQFRSGYVGVSLELLQDAELQGFDWGAVLETCFARRHARGIAPYLINGTGSSQPTGLITATVAAGAQYVVAAGSASNDGGSESGTTSLGTQDFGNCWRLLDPFYRKRAVWFVSPGIADTLQNLLDKYGHPIIKMKSGLFKDDVPTIYSRPVAICPSMPAASTSSALTVVLADPSFILQRYIRDSVFIRRFDQSQQMILYGLVGFQSFMRCDQNCLSMAKTAVYIQQHS